MITLQNICKTYRTKHQTVEALKNVSLTLPDRGMVFITGKSGGGKTTLLNVLGGLDSFDSGDFLLNGKSVRHFRESDWNKYRNSLVGYVFQENNLFEEFNVYENVSLALDLQKVRDKREPVMAALREVGLDEYASRRINELSGGQKQRVAIARAIAKNSSILLADEPTGSLDSVTGKEIFTLLKEISKKQLVVVVSHDLPSAEAFGDIIIEISDGKIVSTTGETTTPGTETTTGHILQPMRSGVISFGRKLKMALKSFYRKPIRFIVLILLCTFGFSLMAGALKFCNWEPYSVEERVLQKLGCAYIQLAEREVESDSSLHMMQIPTFDADSIEAFLESFPELTTVIQYAFPQSMPIPHFYDEPTMRQMTYYSVSAMNIAPLDTAELEQLGFSLVAGEYPSSSWQSTDIAVSNRIFEMYQLFGFYSYNLETAEESRIAINKPQDLIGKDIGNGYIIRGIIDTKSDKEEFAPVKKYALNLSSTYELDYITEMRFSTYRNLGFANTIFCKPGLTFPMTDIQYLTVVYDEAAFSDSGFIHSVLDGDDYRFCDYDSRVIFSHNNTANRFGNIMLIVSVIMIAFAVILFINFITVSITDKSREIGILCALGTGKPSILSVFVLQNILTGLLIFAASFFAIRYAVFPLLLLLGAPEGFSGEWYSIVPVDYAIIFATILCTAIISSLLPFLSFRKKSPRKIIYGK